ncbi:MAG: hypothetical protein QW045_00285 [Candidatus Micrarchaeaceae archaeon]
MPENIIAFKDVAVEFTKDKKTIHFDPENSAEMNYKKYKENFDTNGFKEWINKIREGEKLAKESGKYQGPYIYQNYLRYGAGAINIISFFNTGTYSYDEYNLIFPVRTYDAPRMPGVVDVASGLGESKHLHWEMQREGIEETIVTHNSEAKGIRIAVPEFAAYNSLSIFNKPILEKVKEVSKALNLGGEITFVGTPTFPIELPGSWTVEVKGEVPPNTNFPAVISFESNSVELIVGRLTLIPADIQPSDVKFRDTEVDERNNMLLNRKSLEINIQTGEIKVYQGGEILLNGKLADFLKTIDLSKTGDVYATGKVATFINNVFSDEESIKRQIPLLRRIDPSLKELVRGYY